MSLQGFSPFERGLGVKDPIFISLKFQFRNNRKSIEIRIFISILQYPPPPHTRGNPVLVLAAGDRTGVGGEGSADATYHSLTGVSTLH